MRLGNTTRTVASKWEVMSYGINPLTAFLAENPGNLKSKGSRRPQNEGFKMKP